MKRLLDCIRCRRRERFAQLLVCATCADALIGGSK